MTARTPAQVAEFDQAWARVNGRLDALIHAHRTMKASEPGTALDIQMVGMGQWVAQHTSHESCAELAAAAILRLAGESHTPWLAHQGGTP